MAGSLTISTLKNDTGVLSVANGMTGIPKAWVNFSGVTTTTINSSFNVSSVTRNATGDYTINFTTAMADANYVLSSTNTSYSTANYACTALALKGTMASTVTLKSTTQVQVVSIVAGNAGAFDTINASLSIFGN